MPREGAQQRPAHAQKVTLPVIINGRIDRPDDWDVFQFTGRAGETIVAEVLARRLDSPLGFSCSSSPTPAASCWPSTTTTRTRRPGTNTHDADSYLVVQAARRRHVLRAPGRHGPQRRRGVRLPPADQAAAARFRPACRCRRVRPCPARAGPASLHWCARTGSTARQAALKDPPPGFVSSAMSISRHANQRRGCGSRTTLTETPRAVGAAAIEGRAQIGGREVVHAAVPAEDRMQAFLWRHLVPAERDEGPRLLPDLQTAGQARCGAPPLPPPATPEAPGWRPPIRPPQRASSPSSRSSVACGRSSCSSKKAC